MIADRLIVEGIEAQCRLGVFDWEREKSQAIWIDLELAIDASRAAAEDDVEAAVDYAALVAAVRAEAERRSVRLLETLAEAIASLVVRRFQTTQVRVRIKKRALPGIGYAAVEVERRRARVRVRARRVVGGLPR